MSNVVMRIEPAPGPWPGDDYVNCWPIGGEVTGQVFVSSPAGQRARRVYVELEWLTRGRGDRDRAAVGTAELISGDVPAGAPRPYPFRFTIPETGPISYQGHLIQVEWRLRACVDVPWGKDIDESFEISVLPA